VNETRKQHNEQPVGWKLILLEAVAIAAIGLAFSLTANLLSPRGLSLARDYFPGTTSRVAPRLSSATDSNVAVTARPTNTAVRSAMDALVARLGEQGLRVIDGQEAKKTFENPQYDQELFVFIDARDDRHYEEGHVPGAYQFDRYYPEKHLAAVLPACLTATKIVVYCTGGNCEDSEFAALALREAGVPQERLFVYVGGMTDWATNAVPIEVGGRKSGTIRDARPSERPQQNPPP